VGARHTAMTSDTERGDLARALGGRAGGPAHTGDGPAVPGGRGVKCPSGDDDVPGVDRAETRCTEVRKSAAAVLLEIDASMPEILGWSADDLLGRTSLDFIHPDDQAIAVENWMQMLSAPGRALPLRIRHRHRDGSWVWVEMVNDNRLDDPAAQCVVAHMVDVSAEMPDANPPGAGGSGDTEVAEGRPLQLHEALRAREQLLHRLAEALPLGVLHVDAQGRVLYTNSMLHSIVGVPRARSFADQLATVVADDAPGLGEAFTSALERGRDSDLEIRLAIADGEGVKETRQCTLSVRTLMADDGSVTGAVACLADVTDSAKMREELLVRASFDKLTRCYNRASTMDALDRMLSVAVESARPAVIFVDLEDFKAVNDRHGHVVGDGFLEVVARRLMRSVRAGDVVGRIGGDEFLVLCPQVRKVEEALGTATRIARSLGRPITLRTVEVPCRASVGVAWSPAPGVDADGLIAQADAAMYQAKRSGQGRPVLYRPSAVA